jgi:hypothetical protein
MTTKINANAGTGLTETIDASGILELQTANTTAVIIGTDQNANFTSTGAITLPNGTTAQRPAGANVANGMLRYNTGGKNFEAYLNGAWASVTNAVPYTVTYLLVAGGGSGGQDRGAGGGAGGFLTGTTTLTIGTTYSFVIGAGAATTGTPAGGAIRGSNSTALSLTAVGGGGGISADGNVGNQSGGSGGGGAGAANTAGGAGTSGQGNAGGTGTYTAPNYGGGGGGGAGAVGGNGTSTAGGAGGVGLANPIVGSTAGQNVSSTYYLAGGGGAGTYAGGTAGSGGNGGGGAGATGGTGNSGTSGTANTGGGGGGGSGSPIGSGGLGGSGVFVLSVPTASYSNTYANATVTTSGANTILTYTTSGSYTG